VSFPLLAVHARSRNPAVRTSAEELLDQLSQLPPQPLQVFGLGRFEVRQGRRTVPERDWSRRKAGELFRFLLVQPEHAAPRGVVLEGLWPEHNTEAAQTHLHQATSTLRRILEQDLPDKFPSRYLDVAAQRLALRLPGGSTLDFKEFEDDARTAVGVVEPGSQLAALEAALARYQGPLFPLDLYADWSAVARERLAAQYLSLLLSQAQTSLDLNRPAQALEAARRALAADPWREDAALLGMRACLALDDRPGALRLYRELERQLRDDLDLAPRADVRALAEALRDPQ
jgi:DNA-binding SARP family transcriptional activator